MANTSFDYTVGDFNYIEHSDGAQIQFTRVRLQPADGIVDVHQ